MKLVLFLQAAIVANGFSAVQSSSNYTVPAERVPPAPVM
jgi:hypothetical protein